MKTLNAMLSVIVVAVCLSLTSSAWANYASTVESDNPLSFWEFEDAASNDGATCADTMGVEPGKYRNTGTGADIALVPGLVGQASEFHGVTGSGKGNYVDVQDNSYYHNYRLESSLTCTLECLVKANPSAMTDYGRLIQHENGGTGNYGLGSTTGGNLQLTVLGCGSTWYTWPPKLFDGNWHSLVVTYAYDGTANTTESWYCDSVLQQTRTIAGSLTPPDNWSDLIFGAEGNQNYVYNGFKGDLDEVAYYNYALSQDQVTAHFNAIPEPSALALLGLGGSLMLLAWRRNRRSL